ncbi:MAG TPA: sugar-binding protein, partial [Saprospiraceae bacterium]|nr:sugar-binding protein [Saprospiraceae bacterium]
MSRDSFVGFSMALLLALFVWFLRSPQQPPTEFSNAAPPVEVDQLAPYGSPVIDGKGDDAVWEMSEWLPLDQVWIGKDLSADDFNGRYKLAWDENNLYVLAEITDDTLIDIHPDGLDHYWDDDCLEIFIDEDASGGNHQYNYNAFAYHIALDGKVVDIA